MVHELWENLRLQDIGLPNCKLCPGNDSGCLGVRQSFFFLFLFSFFVVKHQAEKLSLNCLDCSAQRADII
jgi:hypothetical protein